jgi:DNA repair protein RadD
VTTTPDWSHQPAAVDAVFRYWERGGPGSPLIEVATGGGKSRIMATIASQLVSRFGARVLILAHRQELIRQNAAAVQTVDPHVRVGVWSAGLGLKSLGDITVAGIQSVWRSPAKLGRIDVVIVDEAHLISGEDNSMYGKLLAGLRQDNPDLRLVGLTATPYRLGQGLLTEGDNKIFDCVIYKAGPRELVQAGVLVPLVTEAQSANVKTDGVKISGGDFIARDLELAFDLDQVNSAVASDVARLLAGGRKSALVFSSGVTHASHLRNALQMAGVGAEVVVGDTPNRAHLLERYKSQELQCLVSCDVLTTGFDAPCTDVLALVRATLSPGLYVQMLGRAMRRFDGKSEALILDYGGNIARHGPITDVRVKAKFRIEGGGLAPFKVCPQCSAENAASSRACIHCDFEFPPPEKKANATASPLNPMEAPAAARPVTVKVGSVECMRWLKKNAEPGKPPTLRMRFLTEDGLEILSEYLCLEHDGFVRHKAEKMWNAFFRWSCPEPGPDAVANGVKAWELGAMRNVRSVTYKMEGKWPRLVSADIVGDDEREPGIDNDEQDSVDRAKVPDAITGLDDLPF